MREVLLELLKFAAGGVVVGGLTFLAAERRRKSDTSVALVKVNAEKETAGRSVAVDELELALKTLKGENVELKEEVRALRIDVAAIKTEHERLRDSEQRCQQDLAFLRGKFEALAGAAQGVIHAPVEAAIAAQPTEETEP